VVLPNPPEEPTLLVLGQATRIINDNDEVAVRGKQETVGTLRMESVETASRLDCLKDVFAFPRRQLADNQKVGAAALRELPPVIDYAESRTDHPPCLAWRGIHTATPHRRDASCCPE
jgi:hypothetical protein